MSKCPVQQGKNIDFSTTQERKKAVFYGLFIGDSLGATSEFSRTTEVGKKYKLEIAQGWPAIIFGGGSLKWKKGQPTDDSEMAMGIIKSFLTKKEFDVVEIAKNFVEWKKTGPSDIGNTVRGALSNLELTKDGWYKGGLKQFKDQSSAANGALMRNGPMACFTMDKDVLTAIEYTVQHAIITHFHPLSVIPCVIHTLLIRKALEQETPKCPTMEDINSIIKTDWSEWKQKVLQREKDDPCKIWIETIQDQLENDEKKILEELEGFEKFDPYTYNYKGVSGYSVLTFKITLWCLYWSFQDQPFDKIPEWLPKWGFQTKFNAIQSVALIGADSDTYGAVGGSLLSAHHPSIPETYLYDIELYPFIEKNFK